MAAVAAAPIFLNGAPDSLIGTQEGRSSAVPMMQIDLTDDVLEELLACTKTGKAPHIIFGRTPTLRYNGKTQVLDTSTERFRNEVYTHGSESAEGGDWAFAGLVSHSLALQVARDAAAGVDAALEALKQNLNTASQEREARQTESTDNIHAPLNRKGLSKKAQRQSFLRKPFLGSSTHSQPTSPSFSTFPPSTSSASISSTDIPSKDPKEMAAFRRVITHFLAIEPMSFAAIRSKTHIPPGSLLTILGQVARMDDRMTVWKLHDKMFKELDIFKFKYESERIREKAVENAVKAFDRTRVSRDDPAWQLLLPKEKRGKGIVLSRFNFSGGAIETSRTPVIKPIDKKTGLPKKTATKKANKEEEAKPKEKKVEAEGTMFKGRSQEKKMEEEGLMIKGVSKSSSKGDVMKKKTTASKEKLGVSTASKGARGEGKSPQSKLSKSTSGSARPSQATKPKNPSPLSASPPVNASDFEDDHPVHKALSAAPSPAKSNAEKPMKRKALDHAVEGKNGATTKKRKADAEPSVKRKATDTIDVGGRSGSPTKKTKVNEDSNTPVHRRNLSSSSSLRPDNEPPLTRDVEHTTPPTSASPSPPPLRLSWRQTMNLAQQFKSYYPAYEKLYQELATSPHPPTAEKRAELMKMHNKLEQMKREIGEASLGR